MSDIKKIAAWDLRHELDSGRSALLVDVRTPVEFRALHAEGAINVPLNALSLERLRAAGNGNADAPVYFLCRTGARAAMACERLSKTGFKNAAIVEGGVEAWEQAGLPVVRGKKAVSLERQVRIVAGSLVLAGSLLAAFVHPWFGVVPAFVGGGLAFAGITDTCAMGMLLARMPWNNVADVVCQS